LTNNQISISLGQIVNSRTLLFPSFEIHHFIFSFLLTESYSGSPSTLYIVVYGRIFKTDSISSYAAGTMTAQVSSTTSSTVTQNYTIYALPAIGTYAIVS
jgi:hypothetical protein